MAMAVGQGAAVAEQQQTVWDLIRELPNMRGRQEFVDAENEKAVLEDDLDRLAGYIRVANADIAKWQFPGCHRDSVDESIVRKRDGWQAEYDAKRARFGKLNDLLGEHSPWVARAMSEVRTTFEPELAKLAQRAREAEETARALRSDESRLVSELEARGYLGWRTPVHQYQARTY